MVKSSCRVGALCALLGALLACGPVYGRKDLIGTWEGRSEGIPSLVVTFRADGGCRVEYVDRQEEVRILTGRFETDFSKTPVPLTIRGIPQLPHPLHTIIKFRGADSLVMGSFAPRQKLRPISFAPATQFLLERRPGAEAKTPQGDFAGRGRARP